MRMIPHREAEAVIESEEEDEIEAGDEDGIKVVKKRRIRRRLTNP